MRGSAMASGGPGGRLQVDRSGRQANGDAGQEVRPAKRSPRDPMKPLLVALASCLMLAALAPSGAAHIAPPRDTAQCVTLYDFPDAGYKVCVDLEDSGCTIYTVRTTFIG